MPERVCLDHHLKRRRGSRTGWALVVAVLLASTGCDSKSDPASVVASTSDESVGASAGAVATASPPGEVRVPSTQAATTSPSQPDCASADCHEDLLQAVYRHAPLLSGTCDSCHGPEQPEHKFALKRPETELCTFCHPVIGEQEHLHEVIRNDGCLPCHDPHGSNTKYLLTAPGIEPTCRECHDLERKANLHGPLASGECTACHQPHESDNRFLLLGGEGRAHCLLCHEDEAERLSTAKVVHEPVEEDCTACHEAHSSDHAALLADPIDELCLGCHAELEEQVAAATTPHGAVVRGRQCANCHDPHAGERSRLLLDELQPLCLSCHADPLAAGDRRTIPDMRPELLQRNSLHGPVQTGECDVCHEPHGSPYTRLLRRRYPSAFYTPFDPEKYALCFQCHDSAAFLSERTETDTNFRDRDRNLHYLHVNRAEKGRTCHACHEMHGSDLPRHMAKTVPFEGGGWAMPVGFRQTETGGSCSPGCHRQEEYRRQPKPLGPTPADVLNN